MSGAGAWLARLAATTALTTSTAWAQLPAATGLTSDQSQGARAAYQRGVTAYEAQRWSDAIEAFETSYRLRPHPVTSYDIGYCEQAIGHYTRALALFRRALLEHASARHGELPPHLIQAAKLHVEQAEERVARVRVTVASAQTRLLVDGRPLEPLPSATSFAPALLAGTRQAGAAESVPARELMIWLDPGIHVFVFERPRSEPLLITRRLASGEHGEIVVAAVPQPLPQPQPKVARRGVDRGWGILSVGVGAAGLGVGALFGYAAWRDHSRLQDICGPNGKQCPEVYAGEIASLRRTQTAATASLGVAAVGAALGVLLLTVFDDHPRPAGGTRP